MIVDHQKVRALFVATCDLPPHEQTLLLDDRCGEDYELRSAVERLLREDRADSGLFTGDDFTSVFEFTAGHASDDSLPQCIGRYRIREKLGEGGMGIVYLGEQDKPNRTVALKIMRPRIASSSALRRFELEAEVLGRLQHPGIAQIYEAGTAETNSCSQPFFAMEYVQGAPLLEYAEREHLGTRGRLQLFTRICHAVQHAHQHGVVHRDLKPANILITANGQPKILDFGVARLTDSDIQATTRHTDIGQLIGTIPYMSPEQIAGDPKHIDARSDVYELGVLMYELLTGQLPHDVTDKSIPEAARIISENEPTPLSSHNRIFRGDLDTIASKALQKEPDRRYQLAADLASDIDRYLADQPIVARPNSRVYQFRKFAKRNTALVTGLSIAFAALTGGAIAATWGMFSAREAASRTMAMNAFMMDLLGSANIAEGNADVRFVEVLRDAADDAAAQFSAHPETEIEVRALLGQSFSNLTLYRESLDHLLRAYELSLSMHGPADRRTRQAALNYAVVLTRIRKVSEAKQAATDILQHTPAQEIDSVIALRSRTVLAEVLHVANDFEASDREYAELLATARASLGDDHPLVTTLLVRRGWLHWTWAVNLSWEQREAHLRNSESLLREALDRYRQTNRTYSILSVSRQLAEVLQQLMELREAEELCRSGLEIAEGQYGDSHNLTVELVVTLSRCLYAQRLFEEAADLRVRGVDAKMAREGESAGVLAKMSDGLSVLYAAGRFEDGERYARILYERFKKMAAHSPGAAVRYQAELARFLSMQGKLDEADSHFQQIIAVEDQITDPADQARIDLFYAQHLIALGDYEHAEQRLLNVMDSPFSYGVGKTRGHETLDALIDLYTAIGQSDQVDHWQALLDAHIPHPYAESR